MADYLFSSLSWPERVYRMAPVLAEVLRTLEHVAPTDLIVDRVAAKLGTTDRNGVAALLLKAAPKHPAAAHSGPEFMRFGRLCRRWMWTPGAYPTETLTGGPVKDVPDRATPIVGQTATKPLGDFPLTVALSALDDQAQVLRLFPDGDGRRGAERVLRELRERFKRLADAVEDPADEADDEKEEPNPLA